MKLESYLGKSKLFLEKWDKWNDLSSVQNASFELFPKGKLFLGVMFEADGDTEFKNLYFFDNGREIYQRIDDKKQSLRINMYRSDVLKFWIKD